MEHNYVIFTLCILMSSRENLSESLLNDNMHIIIGQVPVRIKAYKRETTINQSQIFWVVQVITSLLDPLKVGEFNGDRR